MSITEITKDNFESEITNSPVLAVLDFWGPGCGPCMALMPKYHALADTPKYDGRVKFCSVDTSRNRRVAMMLRPAVMGLPAFVFYKNGHEAARLGGNNLTIETITAKVNELAGL
ncbi:MAG: thioredoxin family protein [Synergistaceae bacterium]|nr:thioredoxin family protein [Synergistaceae bacterium]MBQ7169866.1 thioredoxin family protein [Synergistaceae bacterium]